MIQEYTTAAQIDAPADAVWRVLTDGPAYREWNQEIIAIDGQFADGERVTAHVKLGDGAIRKLTQRVTMSDAARTMAWVSGLPFGLFVGRRTFTVTPRTEAAGGGAEFRMHLRMSGLLASFIVKSVGDRQPEIDRFSSSLKARAEALVDRGR